MDNKVIHIIVAYVFHVVFIVMSLALMQHHYDGLLSSFVVLGIAYLIYWLICSWKKCMPWSVYLHFLVGMVIQLLLNLCGIVPEDVGIMNGIAQFFYVILLGAHALLLGLINLILYMRDKIRKREVYTNGHI